MAVGDHSGRDMELLRTTFMSGKPFSAKLHGMYAKELFMAGRSLDFLNAQPVFEETIGRNSDGVTDCKRKNIFSRMVWESQPKNVIVM
jgi:hypothetical protein